MKIFSGKVISNRMQKTATVVVERVVVHPVYKKRYRRTKKYHVHDTFGAEVGQMVKFIASKPFSRIKRWKVIEIIERDEKGGVGRKKVPGKKSTTRKTQKDSKKTQKKERRTRAQKK